MREHIEVVTLAGRLDIHPDDLDTMIDDLGIRVVEARGERFLRASDAGRIVQRLDRAAVAMWRGAPAFQNR